MARTKRAPARRPTPPPARSEVSSPKRKSSERAPEELDTAEDPMQGSPSKRHRTNQDPQQLEEYCFNIFGVPLANPTKERELYKQINTLTFGCSYDPQDLLRMGVPRRDDLGYFTRRELNLEYGNDQTERCLVVGITDDLETWLSDRDVLEYAICNADSQPVGHQLTEPFDRTNGLRASCTPLLVVTSCENMDCDYFALFAYDAEGFSHVRPVDIGNVFFFREFRDAADSVTARLDTWQLNAKNSCGDYMRQCIAGLHSPDSWKRHAAYALRGRAVDMLAAIGWPSHGPACAEDLLALRGSLQCNSDSSENALQGSCPESRPEALQEPVPEHQAGLSDNIRAYFGLPLGGSDDDLQILSSWIGSDEQITDFCREVSESWPQLKPQEEMVEDLHTGMMKGGIKVPAAMAKQYLGIASALYPLSNIGQRGWKVLLAKQCFAAASVES